MAIASIHSFDFNQNIPIRRSMPINPNVRMSQHLPNSDSAGGNGKYPSKLCANYTRAKEFVTKLRQLITTLEANDSYTGVLQKHAQTVAYIKNTNMDLIQSNCTAYFLGFQNARNLDLKAQAQQEKYEDKVSRLYQNIIQSLGGISYFGDNNF